MNSLNIFICFQELIAYIEDNHITNEAQEFNRLINNAKTKLNELTHLPLGT